MTEAARQSQRMTVDEFFAWDSGGHQGKLELVDGVVRAMAPASQTHVMIQGNLVYLIGAHLRARKSPCRVAPEAPVVPKLRPDMNARAPDVAVTCAPPSTATAFPDPVLIIEVLSPGNERDTWESIWACATIPSLEEIVVVESRRVGAQVFRRDANGNWPGEAEEIQAGGALRLTTIDAAFPIEYLYAGTHLA